MYQVASTLLPGANQPDEQDEERSIHLTASRLFHLLTERDEQLA